MIVLYTHKHNIARYTNWIQRTIVGRLVTKAQGLHRKTQWQSTHKLNSKNYCFWFVTKAQGLHYQLISTSIIVTHMQRHNGDWRTNEFEELLLARWWWKRKAYTGSWSQHQLLSNTPSIWNFGTIWLIRYVFLYSIEVYTVFFFFFNI